MLLRFSVASADHPAPASCFVFPRDLESWSLANPLWLLNDIVSLVQIDGIMPGLPASLSFTISGIRESGKADSRSLSSCVTQPNLVCAIMLFLRFMCYARKSRSYDVRAYLSRSLSYAWSTSSWCMCDMDALSPHQSLSRHTLCYNVLSTSLALLSASRKLHSAALCFAWFSRPLAAALSPCMSFSMPRLYRATVKVGLHCSASCTALDPLAPLNAIVAISDALLAHATACAV